MLCIVINKLSPLDRCNRRTEKLREPTFRLYHLNKVSGNDGNDTEDGYIIRERYRTDAVFVRFSSSENNDILATNFFKTTSGNLFVMTLPEASYFPLSRCLATPRDAKRTRYLSRI